MVTVLFRKACAEIRGERELLTAGMANAVTVRFEFADGWAGLQKTAVFTDGKTTVDLVQAQWDGDTVRVPPEVTREAGRTVRVGIYGTDGEKVILPTIWAELGRIAQAVTTDNDPTVDPALPVWAQLQNQIGSLADLQTAAKNNLVAAINEARQSGGGGGGGGGGWERRRYCRHWQPCLGSPHLYRRCDRKGRKP